MGEAETVAPGALDELAATLRGASSLEAARALVTRRVAPAALAVPDGAPGVERALLERRLGQTLRALRLVRAAASTASRLLAAESLRCCGELAALEPAAPPAAGRPARPAVSVAELRAERVPLYAAAPLAHLDAGGDPDLVRGALVDRTRSVLASAAAVDAEDDLVEGLRFDLARNTWISERVARNPSWQYRLRLAQFLDWELPGFFSARDALEERLFAAAQDPLSGRSLVPRARVAALVADLVDAASLHDHGLPVPLDLSLDLQFASTDAGDRPSQVSWHMEPRLLGALAALLDDGDEARALAAVAGRARREAERERAPKREALRSLLERYPGVPLRHRRGHWVLVNLANVGLTVAEIGRDGSVLPRSRTTLSPATLAGRYADVVRLKLRFSFNDHFEMDVLSDDDYWQVLKDFGFPPNHETLCRARPMLAAGYVTITRGRVVSLEDDNIMVPGKMPPGLPPLLDVLLALGIDVDHEQIEASGLVVDYSRFAAAAGGTLATPDLPEDIAPEGARALFQAASHAERPPLVVAAIGRWIAAAERERPGGERTATLDAAAARLAEALRGYRLINTGSRAVALGELPKDAEWIDESLAGHMVRKVARR